MLPSRASFFLSLPFLPLRTVSAQRRVPLSRADCKQKRCTAAAVRVAELPSVLAALCPALPPRLAQGRCPVPHVLLLSCLTALPSCRLALRSCPERQRWRHKLRGPVWPVASFRLGDSCHRHHLLVRVCEQCPPN